jgi:hypothetical protein
MMPKSSGYIGIIEAREALPGWVDAKIIKSKDAQVWIDFLLEYVISRYGIVQHIVSDNGELNSQVGLEFMKKYGIEFTTKTTYHPQGNAEVERGHRNIREAIEKSLFGDMKRIWDTEELADVKEKCPITFTRLYGRIV